MGEPAIRDRILASSGWKCQRQLGRGQYGTAYLVEWAGAQGLEAASTTDLNIGDQAVAKVVGLEFLPEKEHNLAFQEVELMRQLKHPHIVALRDHFLTEASLELVIVMEYCDGGDLRGEVKRRTEVTPPNRIPEAQIMTWFVQLTLALNYMHQRHILHRDLKSSNIFLIANASDGHDVKIGDFGISRVLEGTVDVAATVVGTPYYMSPEVCKAEPYGFKSDIWALGCVLYEMCMLKHAFESQSLLGLVYKIVSETYDPIPSQYSIDLKNLIDRVLDKSHYTRPSGKDLIADAYVRRFDPTSKTTIIEDLPPGATLKAFRLPGVSRPSPSLAPPGLRAGQREKAVEGLRQAEVAPTPPTVDEARVGGPAQPPSPAAASENPLRREWHAPPFVAATPKMDENALMARVLLNRIRRALAARRQNWLQVFASFDTAGSGQLPEAEFERAITSMALGLSDQEIREVRIHLQGSGAHVPVDVFGQELHKTPVEVSKLEEWGRGILASMADGARSPGVTSASGVCPGASVRVHGLQSNVGAKLNGCEGIVDKWDAATSRWVVRFSDGTFKSVRDENLEALRPSTSASANVAPSSSSSSPSGVPDTNALYRLLCEDGETAVLESRVLDVVKRLQPHLDEKERRQLLVLLPKSPEGRVDVPEALAQLVSQLLSDQNQTLRAGQGMPNLHVPPRTVRSGPPGGLPGPPVGPTLLPWVNSPTARNPGTGATQMDVPGTIPSPRANVGRGWEGASPGPSVASASSPKHGAGGNNGNNAGGAAQAPSRAEGARVEMALLRFAQHLLGKPSSPGPGVDVLKLFAQKATEIRLEELLDAVSVLPLGISRAEVQGVFSFLVKGQAANAVIPFTQLAAAAEAAHQAGVPAEAASLEKLDLKRLAPALNRLASQAGGRAAPQEFRVTVMQAEPYLTSSQLEWLTLLTDKDGEGRLMPVSLLVRLGFNQGMARTPGTKHLPWSKSSLGQKSLVAPAIPRQVVVAAVMARVRDRLQGAGTQLSLERILGLFDLAPSGDRSTSVGRDVLVPLMAHLRLGISANEADEVVSSLAAATSGRPTTNSGVRLASLFDMLHTPAEADEILVQEIREIARARLFGRGQHIAAAAGCGDAEFIPEADFRRGLRNSLLYDDSSPIITTSDEEEDGLLLLAEKNASGEVRWRPFAQAYAGWLEIEINEPPERMKSTSPKGALRGSLVTVPISGHSCSQQSWRSTQRAAAISKTVVTPVTVRSDSEMTIQPSFWSALCRCCRKLP